MNSSTQKGEMPFSRSCIHAGGNGHVVPYSESQPSKSNSASPPCPSPTLEDRRPHKKVVRYKECLKNHAATIGGNATDGCGEFMPSTGDEGTIEALKCSACNCHRNFHRKEIESHCSSQCYHTHLILNNAILGLPIVYPANSLIVSYKSGSVPTESDEKDDDDDGCGVVARPAEKVRKRFRTKVHKRTEGKDVVFCREGWVEDAEARRIYCAAVLPRDWDQEESPQGVDAQQQTQICTKEKNSTR
ncbi:hypothetical protein SO802_021527 [Lithocarpus litseifolius]|uniref:ZF-HD dimerization-type domain-containing protein n=1 Tax=Lithocarpus litseifolius TaxID=425828 RepID=A0AAW2CF50_9ROSI